MRNRETETISSLSYLRTLPKTRWAWEFLRRNPDYEADYARHMEGALSRINVDDGFELLKLKRAEPEAEKWGLLFFASTNQTALTAPVFWCESVSPQIITVDAQPLKDGDAKGMFDRLFDLALFGSKRIHLTDAIGNEHVLLQRGRRVVQMRCRGHTLLDGNVKLRFVLDGFGHIDAKFATIKRLAKLYDEHTGNTAVIQNWSASTASLRDALIALDAHQAGFGYRETAIAIYGEKAVTERFAEPDKSMKNRMVRARKKGIELMEGGYLDLMKVQ